MQRSMRGLIRNMRLALESCVMPSQDQRYFHRLPVSLRHISSDSTGGMYMRWQVRLAVGSVGGVSLMLGLAYCQTPDSSIATNNKDNPRLSSANNIDNRRKLPKTDEPIGDESEKNENSIDEEVVANADAMYEQIDNCPTYQQLFDYLRQYKDSNSADVLWRLAAAAYLAASDLAAEDDNRGAKRMMLGEGLASATHAVAADSSSAGAHRWFAILTSRCTELDGFLVYVRHADVIRQHLETAIHLKPDDHASYFMLGSWHHYYASFDTLLRVICTVLLSPPPAKASHEEALRCFEAVERLQPGQSSANLWLLADTCRSLQRYDLMVSHLRKLATFPVRTNNDRLRVNQAVNLLIEFSE